ARALRLCGVDPPVWAPVGSPLAAAIRYTVVPAAALQKQIDKLAEDGKSYLLPELADKTESKLFSYKLFQAVIKSMTSKEVHISGAMPRFLIGSPSHAVVGAALYHTLLNKTESRVLVSMEHEIVNRSSLAAGLIGLESPITPAPLAPQILYEVWKPTVATKPKQDEEKRMRDRLATERVQHNMQLARTALEKVKASPDATKLRIDALVNEHGFVRYKTAKAYDRFTIDQAPELAVLKKAYLDPRRGYAAVNTIEGRSGTANDLKEDQFYRL